MTAALCTACKRRLAIDHEHSLCPVCAERRALERQMTLGQARLVEEVDA